jgi:hypothetical protein
MLFFFINRQNCYYSCLIAATTMFYIWRADLIGKSAVKPCDSEINNNGVNVSTTTSSSKKTPNKISTTKKIRKWLWITTTTTTRPLKPKDCFEPISFGNDYTGNISITQSGRSCQAWKLQIPHEHRFKTEDFYGGIEATKNYCR